MIQKIKELMQIKEHIDEISAKLNAQNEKIDSFCKEIDELKGQIAESNSKQKEFLDEFKNNLEVIKESKESLKKEVYDFKLLKTQVQNKLIERFNEELERELKVCTESLKTGLKGYLEAKKDVENVLKGINNVSGEILKLKEISKEIKKEDFALNKYADRLSEMDREKLELMRKIDTLERLISKMRRGNR